MTTHFMVDLETLGTEADSVILSMGYVMFDPVNGAVSENRRRHMVLSIQPQIDSGRTVSGGTIKWWFRQSDEAIRGWNLAESACTSPERAMDTLFNDWRDWGAKYIWSHGSVFDVTMLEDFFPKVPWRFWNIRDTRTLFDVADHKIDRSVGEHHNALDDAVAQAHAVCEAWTKARK